jgi:hypothetical protein
MAITFDSASGTSASATSASFSHVIANQANDLLMVGLGIRTQASTGSTVTYSGTGASQQNLSFYAGYNSSVGARSEIWYLTNPTAGTGTITVTLAATSKFSVNSESYYGVDQNNTFGASGNSTATSTSPNISLTSTVDNSYIYNNISIRAETATFTAAGSNTVRGNFGTAGGAAAANNRSYAADLATTTAGAYTVSGTLSSSTEHVYQAVEIKPFVVTAFGRGYVLKAFK